MKLFQCYDGLPDVFIFGENLGGIGAGNGCVAIPQVPVHHHLLGLVLIWDCGFDCVLQDFPLIREGVGITLAQCQHLAVRNGKPAVVDECYLAFREGGNRNELAVGVAHCVVNVGFARL